jgi:catechol 2,3-dioxygenase-like lactoylglutathione lyase family enzyme
MNHGILGSQTMTQVGILVRDLDKTASAYQELLGLEPTIVTTDAPELAQTKYLGRASAARARLAFFHVGPNLDIELIEPDFEPSTWRHDLDANGEGVHHIAFAVNGMKATLANLGRHGLPLLQTGEYTGGRYAYVDSTEPLKVILELLEND